METNKNTFARRYPIRDIRPLRRPRQCTRPVSRSVPSFPAPPKIANIPISDIDEQPMDLTNRTTTETLKAPAPSVARFSIAANGTSFEEDPTSAASDENHTAAATLEAIASTSSATLEETTAAVQSEVGPPRKRCKFYKHHNYLRPSQVHAFMGCDVISLQTTGSKHAEILTAAKTLFSKRTRTLYHWMYPNTPKQLIKTAVTNSWDHLSPQEKQFYISQVLVKFGFGQCNLMVNPQLGGIKKLADVADLKAELQTAISSISPFGANGGGESAREVKKRGRKPGKKNAKKIHSSMEKVPTSTLPPITTPPTSPATAEAEAAAVASPPTTATVADHFHDDPELSRELESFDVTFGSI